MRNIDIHQDVLFRLRSTCVVDLDFVNNAIAELTNV